MTIPIEELSIDALREKCLNQRKHIHGLEEANARLIGKIVNIQKNRLAMIETELKRIGKTAKNAAFCI